MLDKQDQKLILFQIKIIHIDIDKAEIQEPRVNTLLKINCDCKVF